MTQSAPKTPCITLESCSTYPELSPFSVGEIVGYDPPQAEALAARGLVRILRSAAEVEAAQRDQQTKREQAERERWERREKKGLS